MASSKVICWNSAGIRASAESTSTKIAFFDQQFPNRDFAIAAFVETHHRDENDLPEEFKEYLVTHHILYNPTPPDHTHSGIIVLVNKEFDITCQKEIIPGRLMNIKIRQKTAKTEYNLSIFYGPIWGKLNKNETMKILENFKPIHQISDNNLIMGDFNFVENDIDKGKGMSASDKSIYPFWNTFTSEIAVVDPFRIQCPKKKIYSYIAPTGRSRGDRIYVTDDNIKTITNMKYINTPFNSAHKLLTFDLSEQQDLGPGYWKMNSSVLKDAAYKTEIEEAVDGINRLQLANPMDWWDLFIIVVRGITKSYTTKKAFTRNRLKSYILANIHDLEKNNYTDMTTRQKERYLYFKKKHKDITETEIQGHQIRTRGHPRYEINEPNIDFYAKLEKRSAKKSIITELQDENGQIQTGNENLMKIVENYYTTLYTPSPVDIAKQQQLLKNIDTHISASDRQKLDAPITEDELKTAVTQLNDNKSPGLDGITAEFYKEYWYLIKNNYLQYINTAKQSSFRDHRNTSVTTIIYKHKGEIYILSNYRPISLINVDIKILTKTLTNRLRPILPTIIHKSQTAVDGRKIDHTIHMLRDLIDFVDTEDSEGAFIFLDQEKAFDRVDHNFFYKVMEAFEIGESFLKWVKILYSNATTKIKVNGHISTSVPLNRGVRQGCPLSSLLY